MGGTIRDCRPEDVPAIANLFAAVFLGRKPPAPTSLVRYLEGFLFALLAQDPDLSSLVFLDAVGVVRGFMGVIPHRVLLHGQFLRAAVGSALMVDQPERHPTAGARLVRSFLRGPQDITFSESANAVSQKMWASVGAMRVPAASLDWFRILRPSGFALWKAARTVRAVKLLRPLAGPADRAIARMAASSLALPEPNPRFTERDVGDDEIIAVLPQLTAHYPLRPAWDEATLRYMLGHATAKSRNGPLVRRILFDRDGRPSGCYLYHAKPGEVGVTLQIVGRPDALGPTIDCLIRHAYAVGCVAVRGRTQHDLLGPLQDSKCLFMPFTATMLYARRREIMDEIAVHGGMLSGLAGESWCGLIGGDFK
jgi:hypothetical protein